MNKYHHEKSTRLKPYLFNYHQNIGVKQIISIFKRVCLVSFMTTKKDEANKYIAITKNTLLIKLCNS